MEDPGAGTAGDTTPSTSFWRTAVTRSINVNFRGSTGFGKRFVNAGNLEWAGAMHDDLIDVVDWAVEQGIADGNRIAIMGGSYGGYAALVGLTFTPDVFACGVDIVGPSNLNTLLESVPPYWEPMIALFRTRVGDNSTEDGRRLLAERSPLSRVDSIVKAVADRAGGQRSARETDGVRPDSQRDEGTRDSRDLRPISRRGPRLRSAREQPVLHGRRRSASWHGAWEAGTSRLATTSSNSSIQVLAGESDVPGLAAKLAVHNS